MATLAEIAAGLVAAHTKSTRLTTQELIAELTNVHDVLKKLDAGDDPGRAETVRPAVSVQVAFRKNEVTCLVCGKGGYKALARHLRSAHQMTPGAYKKLFGIPAKQALVAKSYSEARRRMAQALGLGDNLNKAREVRMALLKAKKRIPKAEKTAKPAQAAKTATPTKLPLKLGSKTAENYQSL